ncbi:hypothetical protein QO009_002053 [Brevibacillus aydinogluensis]|uniref:hypothetical protein n=1 Tax=Brevibacillus aydinogluensis TaxID=927786 RepID=UPI002893532D|nr:hypothetical protein [Brevibacillus aydinogluensis]MDT3416185.1 hypothetical protein [Brevibacillus aydinogluensis]
MAQLPSTATIKDIITALQTMECINQKADLAAAVGSPASVSDDVATIISKLQNAKNTLAAYLNAKGGSAAGNESVQSLADKVGTLPVKKWASGNLMRQANSTVVSGLGFRPRVVIASTLSSNGNRYSVRALFQDSTELTFANAIGGPFEVTSLDANGFTLKTDASSISFPNAIYWFAYE